MANEASSELSLVGAGTVIEGKIRTEGSIRIDGKLHGDLSAKINIAVGENGVIEAGIKVRAEADLAAQVGPHAAEARQQVVQRTHYSCPVCSASTDKRSLSNTGKGLRLAGVYSEALGPTITLAVSDTNMLNQKALNSF